MKVVTATSDQRTVTLEATIDELVVLYDATRKGRRSKMQEQALLDFGNLLRESDRDLKSVIEAADPDAGTE